MLENRVSLLDNLVRKTRPHPLFPMNLTTLCQENNVNTDHHERDHENTLLGILFHQIHPQNKQQVKQQREKTLQRGH